MFLSWAVGLICITSLNFYVKPMKQLIAIIFGLLMRKLRYSKLK